VFPGGAPHLISTAAKLRSKGTYVSVSGDGSPPQSTAKGGPEQYFSVVDDVVEEGMELGGWEFDEEERNAALRQAGKGLGALAMFALFRKVVLKL